MKTPSLQTTSSTLTPASAHGICSTWLSRYSRSCGLGPWTTTASFLTVFRRVFHAELAEGWHLYIASWSLRKSSITISRFSAYITDGRGIFHSLPGGGGLGFRLGS